MRSKHQDSSSNTSPSDKVNGLPFDRLISLLKREKFIVDTKDYLEFVRTYEAFGDPGHPEKLKYYLAPIVARNATEQSRFYQLFDSCFTTVAPIAQQKWKWPYYLAVAVGALLLTGVVCWWVIPDEFLHPPKPETERPFASICPVTHSIGVNEPVMFYNCDSAHSPAGSSVSWSMGDGAPALPGNRITYTYKAEGRYMVRLTITNPDGYTGTDSSLVSVCNSRPGIKINNDTSLTTPLFVGDTAHLSAPAGQRERWTVRNSEDVVVHSQMNETNRLDFVATAPGIYTATLSDTATFCDAGIQFEVRDRNPYTLSFTPGHETVRGTYSVNHVYDYLLVALLLLLGYFARKKLEEEKKQRPPTKQPAPADFNGMNGPEEIPFLSKDKYIQPENNLNKLAYRLQQNVQAGVPDLDIQKTIAGTVRNYGMVVPQYRNRKKDREYVMLVDAANRQSPQLSLFKYLIKIFCRVT